MTIEGVENRNREGGVTEGDGFIAETADAGGGIGGVQICRSTGESGDVARVDDPGSAGIESVEYGGGEGAVAEVDGFIAEVADA